MTTSSHEVAFATRAAGESRHQQLAFIFKLSAFKLIKNRKEHSTNVATNPSYPTCSAFFYSTSFNKPISKAETPVKWKMKKIK